MSRPRPSQSRLDLTWPLPTLPTLALGYHIPAADPGNPDTAALMAIEQAVFGETSTLYQELVLKEQKVVSFNAEAESKRDPSLFTILLRVRKPEDMGAVRQRIAAALAEAAQSPIDAARLDTIKSHLRYAFANSIQSPDAVANTIAQTVAVTGRPESINDLYEAFDRLTPADLQRVARKYFRPANETVITLETEIKK